VLLLEKGVMNISKALLFVVVLASVTAMSAADAPKEDAVKDEVKNLQGTWQVTKLTGQGEKDAPADEIKHFTFEFQGDRLTIRKDKNDSGKETKYTLNPSKKPKWIDLDLGLPIEGIYFYCGPSLT
jgi:uncharacterized protein (TIGR03067 family)